MPELEQVWKALFGKDLELAGEESDHPSGKVVRFSLDSRTWMTVRPAGKEYEGWLNEMRRTLGDMCPECREKALNGADAGELDDGCSELLREGIGGGLKSDTAAC